MSCVKHSTREETDKLIDKLSLDCEPRRLMPHPLKLAVPWVMFSFLYVVGVVFFQGFRTDIVQRLADPVFVFELVMASSLSISAALASIWLCIPDIRGQRWIIAVPTVLFAVFSFRLLLHVFLDSFHVPAIHWNLCYMSSLIYGVLPALAIIFLSMRGKTTHPVLMAFMVSISVGGVGYIGLRLVCSSEDIGHICCYHVLPYVLFGFLVSLLGYRLYRW